MSFPKILLVTVVGLFGVIGVIALVKGRSGQKEQPRSGDSPVQEIVLRNEIVSTESQLPKEPISQAIVASKEALPLPQANRMEEFFNVAGSRLPPVETIIYSSRVPWHPGKAAWIADYANHYDTSRHFIARSLNQTRNYEDQQVANGDRFNVFKKDYPVSFHLVVDTGRCRMWVYYLDEKSNERLLVGSYVIGLGRKDEKRESGCLTPHGTYSLGENIAVYRRGAMGLHNGERIEMRRIFGTRWIPFDQEIGRCTASSKGLGLHGCPWTDEGVEDRSGLGEYLSDGCIRLATEDMEELFAVIITKPTMIYIVPDFFEAKLPGKEV